MKNKNLQIFTLVLLSLLILNLFIISIKAESPPMPGIPGTGNINPDTGLPVELEKLTDTGKKLTDEEQRTQYLKQEWGKILKNNPYTAPIIAFFEYISPVTNPIFKYTIGIEPSLTWLFFLTLIIWIAFVIYAIRILDLVSIYSQWVGNLISFGIVIIISVLGITKKIAEYIINAISLLDTWWIQLIGIGLVILALILVSIFSKNLQTIFKTMKKNKEELKERLNRERLKGDVEVAEAFTKGITKK